LIQFANDDQNFFEFKVANYEFPQNEMDEYDSNWLIIAGNAAINGKTWRFRDPALLTFELKWLGEWFEKWACCDGGDVEIGFTEPDLSFSITPERKLTVHFELESRPSWKASSIAGQEDLFIEFDVSQNELSAAAAQVWKMLNLFPRRG